ncbi:NEW3 domain-containing protein [Streptomyces sp. NPDC057582]|uniref:NEW3 domain-containing protein n=1 Tax=Streptomyces sp. NPDC057582 TaxID=3346174 RepID=UPI0036746771
MNPRTGARRPGPRALAAAAMTLVLAASGSVAMSTQAAVAAVSRADSGVEIDAGYLHLGLSGTGQVTALTDRRTGKNYIATGHGTAPLVSLMVGGHQVQPTKVTLGANNTLVFTGTGGFEIDVAVQDKATYSTFTVTKAVAPGGGDLQTLLWGPLPTDITKTLGEAVGIVRDNGFAVGMKPLTDRTEGGWPREEVNTPIGWENEVDSNPSHVSVAPLEEWSVGARTPWGTLLRAFTFDYTKKRDRLNHNTPAYPIPVGPLPGSQGSVVGSSIALFGTTPDMAPTVLSAIATDHDLPYPTINGQWQKTAQATSQSFLVLSDLNTDNVDRAAEYAKAAGIKGVYSLPNAEGPWQSAGHYQFDDSFGSSDSTAADLVRKANADGIQIGAHTLSNFIDTNDPYVTPTPDPDLAVGQSTTLARDLAAGDTTAYLTSCAPLADGVLGQRLLIGDEFVTYDSSSTVDGQCRITGLSHGQWDSTAAAHAAGATASRVLENGYGGAMGGLNIINAVAKRFSDIWNTTGVSATSFDGLESASDAGWGAYGMARMVNSSFHQLKAKDGFISETSRMGSNFWDGLSRASWGEVGSTSMQQVFINNAYYRDNYLPGMLGWISLNNDLQTVEDGLARGAGLNAGTGFETSVSALNHGAHTAAKLDTAKQWETARNLGAFTAEQRAQLRDQSTHWHLSVVTPGRSWSLQELDGSGNPVGPAQTVTAPTPAFTTTGLPALAAGKLYEARVATNSPGTVRYSVTSGSLPAGLTLNRDTGGITGIPKTSQNVTFTITGKGGPGIADAHGTFTTGTVGVAPEVDLKAGSGFATPGGSVKLTASVTNPGKTAMTGVTATLKLPTGWTTSDTTKSVDTVAPGATATASWIVNIPDNAAPGTESSQVSVSYPKGPGSDDVELSLPVAYSSLAATFNNVGITDDSAPSQGNFDGYSNSYSAQALSALGVKAGATLTYNNTAFTWPGAAPGTNNNTRADGQIIPVSGTGKSVAFLGAGIGSPSGTVTVYYTDGTTSTGTLGFPNWADDPTNPFGAEPVITAPYRNTPSGPGDKGRKWFVFYNSVPVTPGKSVAAVQLPQALQSLHVFSIGITPAH